MLEIIAALFKSIKVGFKLVSKGSQEVSIAMDKLEKVLDIKIEEGEKKLEEARKRHEEYEKNAAKEGGFETVAEWRQYDDKIKKELNLEIFKWKSIASYISIGFRIWSFIAFTRLSYFLHE